MTQTTDTTALDLALTLPKDTLQVALNQLQCQEGVDRVKAILESTDPAHKDIQAALVKKVKVWDRTHSPKKPYTGKPRGRKPGQKNAAKTSETAPEVVA